MGKLKWHIRLVLALWLVFCGMASATQLYVNEDRRRTTTDTQNTYDGRSCEQHPTVQDRDDYIKKLEKNFDWCIRL